MRYATALKRVEVMSWLTSGAMQSEQGYRDRTCRKQLFKAYFTPA